MTNVKEFQNGFVFLLWFKLDHSMKPLLAHRFLKKFIFLYLSFIAFGTLFTQPKELYYFSGRKKNLSGIHFITIAFTVSTRSQYLNMTSKAKECNSYISFSSDSFNAYGFTIVHVVSRKILNQILLIWCHLKNIMPLLYHFIFATFVIAKKRKISKLKKKNQIIKIC